MNAHFAIRDAVESGADVPTFVAAAVKTVPQALAMAEALGRIVDSATAVGATFTTEEPWVHSLLRLKGEARQAYCGGMTPDQLGMAVSALAGAVAQLAPYVSFTKATPLPTQPLAIRVVDVPSTQAVHQVTRDDSGEITGSVVVTKPV
jgi:hypothetical protein